ncbi:hypothetical protein ACSFA2_19520 [Variovorax sp. LT2P21]
MHASTRHRWMQAAALVIGLAVLAGVFMLYTQPAFMVTLIDQVWSCF